MNFDEICQYMESKKGTVKYLPFGPEVLVFKVVSKMYAILAWEDDPLRISLKSDPVDALILRQQYAAVLPGYHLNKKHWNTLVLDGSIPDDEVQRMIDDSYQLVVDSLTRKEKAELAQPES